MIAKKEAIASQSVSVQNNVLFLLKVVLVDQVNAFQIVLVTNKTELVFHLCVQIVSKDNGKNSKIIYVKTTNIFMIIQR